MSPKLLNTFLLLLSGALYFFVVAPLYTGEGTSLWSPEKGIVQLRQDKAKYELTLDQVDKIVNQAKQLEKDYASLTDEEKEKLRKMVPDSVDKVRLLSEIINIANNSGVTLEALSVTELKSYADSRLSAYDVNFNIKATYPRFKEIIRNFETSLRLFSTEGVTFGSPTREIDPISFTVRMRTYYMK